MSRTDDERGTSSKALVPRRSALPAWRGRQRNQTSTAARLVVPDVYLLQTRVLLDIRQRVRWEISRGRRPLKRRVVSVVPRPSCDDYLTASSTTKPSSRAASPAKSACYWPRSGQRPRRGSRCASATFPADAASP